MLLSVNSGICADFYSEMEFDPFYSELNPETINREDTATGEFELKKIIKTKLQERKKNKALKTEQKKPEKEKKAIDESFVAKPKKHLTKAQLERELNKEEREKERIKQKEREKEENLTLIEKVFNIKKDDNEQKKKNKGKENYTPPENPNINIIADFMEYFPDKYEVHAVGNAKVVLKTQGIKIEADKIVFDYDKNILKASDNVILTSPDSVTEGDFLKLDLTKPDGWLENPVTITEDILINAKEAFIYSDNITEYDGVAKILKDEVLNLGGRSFSSYVNQTGIFDDEPKLSDENKGVYKLKANTIIIDSKEDHEVVTVKNAGIYLKNHKIATIPTLKIVSNKAHNNIETNIPEFGSQSMLGMHIGPAVVLNVPGGSTLKLAPILTYGNSKLGIGGIARFRSETNMTQIAYGTSKDNIIIKGRQKLAPGFLLNYSRYANQSEWFLGYRMPRYSLDLTYNRSDYIKDLDLSFSQMYSAGIYVDNKEGYDLSNTHSRFRWMTQTYKPLYKYKNREGNAGLNFGIVAQTAANVYSQGNTLGLFRIGPSLNTQVGKWKQSVVYYQTATAGESPFEFDRYRYGKSNLVFIESVKLCKYLTIGYLASIAMHNQYHDDYHGDDLLQENRFMVSLGPEYARVTIGYDSIRHTTMVLLSMLVGTKDSDVEFKKTIIKNPDKIGREKKEEKKNKRKSYKKYLKKLKKKKEMGENYVGLH